jgi:hypothetical protein
MNVIPADILSDVVPPELRTDRRAPARREAIGESPLSRGRDPQCKQSP